MEPDRVPKDELAVRYYRWALAEFEREVREDLPLLRAIKGTVAIRAVAWLDSLPSGDRLSAATTLVKRFHTRARELTGAPWGRDEEDRVREYMEAIQRMSPAEEPYRSRALADLSSVAVNRTAVMDRAIDALEPVLHSRGVKFAPRERRYETPLGPWTLITHVDTGGRVHQLAYHQAIRGAEPRPVLEWISVLSWLGIAGGTSWTQILEPDIPQAADTLARSVDRFLRAAPSLLDGLG